MSNRTPTRSVISPQNSSKVPLGIDESFIGEWINVLDFQMVTVVLTSDVDSAEDGIDMEWSTDGITEHDHNHFTFSATDGSRRFQLPLTASYFKMDYHNGGTAQSTFNLQVIFHPTSGLTSVHRILDTSDSDDRSAALVKAVISAKKPDGTYTNLDATAGGNLKVSIEEVNGTADIATETTQVAILTEFNSVDESFYFSSHLLAGSTIDMTVNGSVTPVLYQYTVPVDTEIEITRAFFVLEDGAIAFIPSNFGALSVLTNGVEIGITPSGGSKVVFETWTTNREIRDTMFDFDQQFRTDGQYVGRWSFTRDLKDKGLCLTAGDVFEIKIQDDLTGLDYMSFKLKGIQRTV